MLRTDIIDLINGGSVWAFVGSGTSVDSDAPTWKALVERVTAVLEGEEREPIINSRLFQASFRDENYPKCFSIMQQKVDREKLNRLTKAEISNAGPPNELPRLLADWPFAGYVTTNSKYRTKGYKV